MTVLEVLGLMAVGWFIVELFRRIILFSYHELTGPRNWMYPTQRQYHAYKEDLAKRKFEDIG